uniref:Uncharacterized protein n=1 Tax=Rhizophora mucronata TaxID=61149 RepID=A0A2P2JVM6_RHIMU
MLHAHTQKEADSYDHFSCSCDSVNARLLHYTISTWRLHSTPPQKEKVRNIRRRKID